ncbi:hypothetical protein OIDMADRAFT_32614 [Oidiodendron maius Zn]|uniref:NAD-dependent epimerase/dehydratase domain-containing protein n=1 Tax=Oidiodendron maius (strain Zn) TaxID=913774 RepID=A0A0C3D435_OIDMZ|nr:hypothetical protein OIDMADRAFT_32614 [Oidiodendron maius Zn]
MTIPGIREPAVSFGSFVVVSGANGFIGSHVADQALAAGYRVRGMIRSVQKNELVREYFNSKYGSDNFELIEVPDMAAESVFDEAVKGASSISALLLASTLLTHRLICASGFVHVASDMSGSTDPNIAV